MNTLAEKFFRENPDAEYWYYSDHLRVPNPRFARRPDYKAAPWPEPCQQSVKPLETQVDHG